MSPGVGWIPGAVAPLQPGRTAQGALKVPHMGWNALDLRDSNHPLLAGFGKTPYVYFVHSFHLRPSSADHLLATVDYGGPVTALVGRANLAGTQVHPEKSQDVGLLLLANFLRWRLEARSEVHRVGKRGEGRVYVGGCRIIKKNK